MKGFGTDEKALIRALATRDPLQIAAIRDAFKRLHNRNLEADIRSETSSWFEKGLIAIVRGPLHHDVFSIRDAVDGPGTKEKILNDVLLGRSNADIRAIKGAYFSTFRRSMEDDVRSDLSMKTKRHFDIVMGASRAEDAAPVIPQQVDQDVMDLYRAGEAKLGTDEMIFCSILTTRNDNQIRAIAYAYEQKFRKKLEDVIKSVSPTQHSSHAHPQQLTLPTRSSPVTWKMHFSTSYATPPTSTCMPPSFLRIP
jgi:annexin A7/11